jgi:hypothetical protein
MCFGNLVRWLEIPRLKMIIWILYMSAKIILLFLIP